MTTQRLAILAIGGGLAYLATAWIGITNPTFDGDLESTVEYLNDAALSAVLTLTVAGWIALRRAQGSPRGATEMVVLGQLLILVGVLAAFVIGEDPSWFAAVGVPGNLLWLIGTVRIGVHTWKARAFPRWVAVAIALTVPAGIVAGEFGGAILPGLMWIYLGRRLAVVPAAVPAAAT